MHRKSLKVRSDPTLSPSITMANFRSERLFIRVAGSLDFDPNEGIDASAFAFIMIMDTDAYDRDSLRDYTFAPFDKPRWFPAAKGMATVRAVIAETEAKLAKATGEEQERCEKDIALLRIVEDRLDMIDVKDYKFYLLARDLE